MWQQAVCAGNGEIPSTSYTCIVKNCSLDIHEKPIKLMPQTRKELEYNSVLGHQGASATYPCFICKIRKNELFNHCEIRSSLKDGVMDTSYSINKVCLLRIDPLYIVPLPLHLFLGIGEVVYNKIYIKLFGKKVVEAALEENKCKSQCSREGGNGKSQLFAFTGAELDKIITSSFDASIAQSIQHKYKRIKQQEKLIGKLGILKYCMTTLKECLLSKGELSAATITTFDHLISYIYKHWQNTFGRNPTPKIHVLNHAMQFAKNHRVLGSVAESQIESLHASMNRDLVRHLNTNHQKITQLRRVLSDTVERAVHR